MIFVVTLLSASIALTTSAITPSASLTNKYTFSLSLDDNENYWLFWSVDHAAGDISFAVQANTAGWVGFGLSPDGRMPYSDIVTGWVNSQGKGFLQDRYSTGKFLPSDAESQDVELVASSEVNQVTTLEFKRKIEACETPNDRSINVGTSRIIWSYNPNDPANDSPNSLLQHTVMGWRSVNLLSGSGGAKVPLPDDVKEFTVGVSNVKVPTVETTYWCSNYTLPDIPNGAHIVGFAPVVTPGNEGIVHHILVYQCFNQTGFNLGHDGNCEANMPDEVSRCRGTAPIAAWAIGGKEVRYPADVGYPFSGTKGPHTVVIEMHYDNPQGKANVIDNSGIKIYYTTTPRKTEAAIMEIGHEVVTMALLLPKKQQKIVVTNLCPAECTQAGLPESGVNVFGTFLHAHTAGIGLKIRHIRNGTQLPYIDRNDYYDFNYQDYIFPVENIKILPGDILQLICTYSTKNRDGVTIGDQGSKDEMCLAYMLVYPVPKMTTCFSTVRSDELTDFLTEAFTEGWAYPYTGSRRYQLIDGLNNLDLSNPPAAGEAYYAFWNTKNRTAYCLTADHSFIAGGDYSLPSFKPLAPDPPPVCATSGPTSATSGPASATSGLASATSGPTSAGDVNAVSALSLLVCAAIMLVV